MSWLDILSYHHFLYAIFKVHARCFGCLHIGNIMRWKLAFISLYIFRCIGIFAVTEKLSLRGARIHLTTSGDNEIRTRDLLLARQALSQLSYTPKGFLYKVGLSGLEPPTSRLSGVRSNRLSYKPFFLCSGGHLLSHTVSSAVPSAA